MTFYLRHTRGSKNGELTTYRGDNKVGIGREDGNELQLAEGVVSGKHARIYCDGETFFIQDLQSKNGTYVNGQLITGPTPLSEGDHIEFSTRGPKVIFSTTPSPQGTIVVSEEPDVPHRLGNKTMTMLRSLLHDAQTKGNGRVGSTTLVFLRGVVEQLSAHSSKRLQFAVVCLGILLAFVTAGVAMSGSRQKTNIDHVRNIVAGWVETVKPLPDQVSDIGEKVKGIIKETESDKIENEEMKRRVKELEDLVKSLQEKGIPARVTEGGEVKVDLPNVMFFDYDSDDLTSGGVEKVGHMADILKRQASGSPIRIEGHASREWEGAEAYNLRLSEHRAATVREALVQYGTPRGLIATVGFGCSRPVASNATEEGRRQNRRVEVIIAAEKNTATPTPEEIS